MLVAVRKPPIDFSITGIIPEKLISGLRKEYGDENVRVDRDDMVNAMEMDWFKELESEDTPGKNMRFYRKLVGMTQTELAKKLGVEVPVSDAIYEAVYTDITPKEVLSKLMNRKLKKEDSYD